MHWDAISPGGVSEVAQLPVNPFGDSGPFDLIHAKLRQLARAAMRRERQDHTLQPTALVNEAYIRLTQANRGNWKGRDHFFSAAARSMRQILVDHARCHNAAKRAYSRGEVELNEVQGSNQPGPELILALDALLERLRKIDARAAHVVELRYFTGLSVEETAELMAVSPKTVKRDWEFARVWLEQQLRSARGSSPQ